MPKAVSQTFRPATIANPKKRGESSGGGGAGGGKGEQASTGSAGGTGGGRNHLFNTDRFGQHILTNPAVAQGYVVTFIFIDISPSRSSSSSCSTGRERREIE